VVGGGAVALVAGQGGRVGQVGRLLLRLGAALPTGLGSLPFDRWHLGRCRRVGLRDRGTRTTEQAEGNRTTPSVVAFTDTDERLVGTAANRKPARPVRTAPKSTRNNGPEESPTGAAARNRSRPVGENFNSATSRKSDHSTCFCVYPADCCGTSWMNRCGLAFRARTALKDARPRTATSRGSTSEKSGSATPRASHCRRWRTRANASGFFGP